MNVKIRWRRALPLSSINNSAAADGVIHQRIDIRFISIHRIIGWLLAHIRIRVPAAMRHEFPFEPITVIFLGLHMRSLLKASDNEPGFGQVLRSD
jgi:hypothetical protein